MLAISGLPPPPSPPTSGGSNICRDHHEGRGRPDRLISHHTQDLNIDEIELDIDVDERQEEEEEEEEEEEILIRPRRRFMKSGMTSYEKWISKNAMGRRSFRHRNNTQNTMTPHIIDMSESPSLTPPTSSSSSSSSSTLSSVINELLDGQTEALSHVDDLFENFHSPKAFVVEKDPTGGKFYVRSFRLDPHVHHQTSRPHSFFTTSKTSKDFMKLPSAEEEHLTLSHQRPSFQFHGSSVGTASCDCRGRRIKRALGLNKFKQRSSLNGFHDTNCGSNISHYSTCSSNSSMNPSPSLTPPPAPPRSIKSILKPLMKNITHSHVVTNSSGGHFHLAENEDKTVMVGMNMYDDQDLPLLDRCNNTFIDQFDQVINVPVVDHERPKLNMPSIIQEDQEMTHTSEVNSQAQVHTKGEKYKKNHRIDDDDDNDEEEEEEEKEEEDDGDVIKSNYSFKNLKDIDFQKPKSSTITTTTTPTSTSMTEMMNESNYHHTSSSSSSSSSSNKSTNPQYGSGLLGYKSNSANRLVGHDGMVNRMKTSRRMNNSKTQNSMSDLTRRLRDARSRIPYEFRGEVFVPVKKSSLGNFLSKNKRVRFDLTRYCHEFEVESNESDDDKQQEQYHVDYHHTFIEYTSESDSDAEEEHVEEYDSDSMEYFV